MVNAGWAFTALALIALVAAGASFFAAQRDPEDPGSTLSGSQIAANLSNLERPICEPPLARPACFRARELASSLAQQSRMKRGSGRPHMPRGVRGSQARRLVIGLEL